MPIIGIINEIFAEEVINHTLRKKAFVLLEEGPFPCELLFELYNEKIALIEPFKKGDRIWLRFRPRGFSKVNEEGQVSRWTSLRPYRIQLYEGINTNNLKMEEPNNGK